jgi:hypothetical protein
MAPPADRPATKTRSAGTAYSSRRLSVRPARDRGLAGAALLIAGPKPVPASHQVAAAGLRRIGDQQAMGFRQGVHPGAQSEVFRILQGAVQHHDQTLGRLTLDRGGT